jgi:hypothetical protein
MAKRTSKKSAKVAKKAAAKRRFTSDRTKHRRVAKVSIGADELENVKIAQRTPLPFGAIRVIGKMRWYSGLSSARCTRKFARIDKRSLNDV